MESGQIEFVPKQYENVYFAWMRNIQDWCISRQQWWGHQIAGANVQGAALIIESLSQYSALMVMEQEYGPHVMRRFLKFEIAAQT